MDEKYIAELKELARSLYIESDTNYDEVLRADSIENVNFFHGRGKAFFEAATKLDLLIMRLRSE